MQQFVLKNVSSVSNAMIANINCEYTVWSSLYWNEY